MNEGPERLDAYQPDRRTAVVLTGAGTAGAYHAGVLKALAEAGVRIDLVAGHGIGATGALFAALDGVTRLSGPSGPWRSPAFQGLYPWRGAYRALGRSLGFVAGLLVVPPLLVALGLVAYEVALLIDVIRPGAAEQLAGGYAGAVASAFQPRALPTVLPQLVTLVVGLLMAGFAIAARRAVGRRPWRRSASGGFWWAIFGAPFSARESAATVRTAVWGLLGGGGSMAEPEADELSRRAGDVLIENLGQPGFRELLVLVHDLDARNDLAFALVAPEVRHDFFLRPGGPGTGHRAAEAIDLGGAARDQVLAAVAGALALPVATDPEAVTFAPEHYWRGETHRLTYRPAALVRLLDEVARAGVRQAVVVAAAPELSGPHHLARRPVGPRQRLNEYLASEDASSTRDALTAAADWFDALFVVRPAHNPVGPLDFGGVYDERSDRRVGLGELVDRGYEDAYRQFVEPVVGASGERLTLTGRPTGA